MPKAIGVEYFSAARDSSGYAEAARGYLSALIDQPDIDLSAKIVSFEKMKTTHGPIMDKIEPFVDKGVNAQIRILHLTPDNFPFYWDKKKYNIGYTVWETDSLPKQWVALCNEMNEIWVPSTWNVKVVRDSGVTVPIIVVPHVIEMKNIEGAENIISKEKATYIFYYIAQYIERKNPLALLKPYLTEFKPDEPVVLVMKSYRLDTSPAEQQRIRDEVKQIKAWLRLSSYPPILFCSVRRGDAHLVLDAELPEHDPRFLHDGKV